MNPPSKTTTANPVTAPIASFFGAYCALVARHKIMIWRDHYPASAGFNHTGGVRLASFGDTMVRTQGWSKDS
ncbi:MAG: hypothetical protein Q6365_014745, partial [Candidatus Sigynarchaeota archaeon]